MSELHDLVLRKIGRNVLNFQKIEGMLKFLVIHSNFKSPVSKIAETLKERKKNFEKQSLGSMAREYFKSFSTNMDHIHEYPEDRDEPWCSFSFTINSEDGDLSQEKAAFSFLISERNRLIHQMLTGYNPDSIESCNALILELDKQHELIDTHYKSVRASLKNLFEANKKLLEEYIQESGDLSGNG